MASIAIDLVLGSIGDEEFTRVESRAELAANAMEAEFRQAAEAAGDSLEEEIGSGAEQGAIRASLALGGVLSLLNEISEAQNVLYESSRALQIASGQGTPEQQASLSDVIGAGFDIRPASEGVAFSSSLGFEGEDLTAGALVATDLLDRGVSRSDLGRSVNVFGVDSPTEFAAFGIGAVASAQAANVDLGEFLGEFRDSATTLRSFNFNEYQSLAALSQAYEAGTVSEVQSFQEQILIAASERNIDPLVLLESIFASVRSTDTARIDDIDLLQQFGGENLLDAINDGTLDYSALQIDAAGITELGVIPRSLQQNLNDYIESVQTNPDAGQLERALTGFLNVEIPGTSLILGEGLTPGATGVSLYNFLRDATEVFAGGTDLPTGTTELQPTRFGFGPQGVNASHTLSPAVLDRLLNPEDTFDIVDFASSYLNDARTPGRIGGSEFQGFRRSLLNEFDLVTGRDDAEIDILVETMIRSLRAQGFGVTVPPLYDPSKASQASQQFFLNQGNVGEVEYRPRFQPR